MARLKKFLSSTMTINNGMIVLGLAVIITVLGGVYYLTTLGTGSSTSPQTPIETSVALPPTWTGESVESPVWSQTSTLEPDQTEEVNQPSSTTTATATETQTLQPGGTLTITPSVTSTGVNQPQEWAKLVSSGNPTDGSYFAPKDQFSKIWTVKNIGTTTWNEDYDLVFISGTAMNDKQVFPLAKIVKPGNTINLKVNQKAPNTPGIYQGFWMLRNKQGKLFGIGDAADQPLHLKINVVNVDPNNAYDFLLNFCDADWWNSKGEIISCPGEPRQVSGFVLFSTSPVLENGVSDKPALWVHPDKHIEGMISGKYPAYLVKDGDHFKARVGCIGGYPKCNVTFKLLYISGGNPNQSLGSWKELAGGGTTNIDVNLSALAGQNVQFILRLVCTNNYPDNAQGFWLTPRIVYIKPPATPTATPTDTPIPTSTDTPVPSDTPVP